MKPSGVLSVSIAFAAIVVRGETFIGPTSSTNRLLVPTNSAIIITAMLGTFTNSTVVLDGFAFTQPFAPLQSGNSYALAGPAELILSNSAAVTYYELTNSAIHTQGIANDPIGIVIPTNKTARLFGVPAPVNASFSHPSGGFAAFTLQPNQPAEFTGPGMLVLSSGLLPPNSELISYFFAEDGFVVPNQRPIVGPTGSYAVLVEKSLDLNTWTPVLLENTSDPDHAFYRLRIQQ